LFCRFKSLDLHSFEDFKFMEAARRTKVKNTILIIILLIVRALAVYFESLENPRDRKLAIS